MNEYEEKEKLNSDEPAYAEPKEPLIIFKTEADRYGHDIMAMSNFFDGYIEQMALALQERSELEVVSEIPIADLGIISDVLHHASVVMKRETILMPDFDHLPSDVKTKLEDGTYKVAESKQVDGNLRPVIVDENGVRVKDITLKKVLKNPNNIETVRSIANQLQMRQIYTQLADIGEFQTYQLEKDRDRDMVIPFLDARSMVLEAETKKSKEESLSMLKEADNKMRTALNAVYSDIETTSKRFAKLVSTPFLQHGKKVSRYIEYLTRDLQIATKYVGVRMQLLEYIGESSTAKNVLRLHQYVIYNFLTKPLIKKGKSTAELLHDYYPYNKSNMNFWYNFSKEMQPVLEASIKKPELGTSDEHKMYLISAEDAYDNAAADL